MTLATASITSSAPRSAFFARWADMATWPEWNTDTAWVRLDGEFREGATGVLKPKGGPRVPFTVTHLTDSEFVDVSRMPGARITFTHHVHDTDDGTRVDASVDITGPLAAVWRAVLGGGFRSSLQPDLDRLAASAEADAGTA